MEERTGPTVVHPLPRRTRRGSLRPRRWNPGRLRRPGSFTWPALTPWQNRLLRQALAALLLGFFVWGLGKLPGETAPRVRQYVLGWLDRDYDFAGAWQRVRAIPVFQEMTGLGVPAAGSGESPGATPDGEEPADPRGTEVAGPPVPGRIVAPFALTPDGEAAHPGVDLETAPQAQVRAVEAGRVASIGYDPEHAGLYVVLVHANQWESLYGRLSAVLVDEGAEVTADDAVGLAGGGPGPTLHFEVRHEGSLVDPTPLLLSEALR